MQENVMEIDVLATPGHLVGVAARGYARLSEARLKPLGFGVGYLPALMALKAARAETQRDLARIVGVEQPSMAQMLVRMERDGLIQRSQNSADGRSRRISLTQTALRHLPEACAALFQGNREALEGFSEEEAAQFVLLLERLIANLDRLVAGHPPAPTAET